MTAQTRAAAQAAVKRRTQQFDQKIAPILAALQRSGAMSLRGLARALEQRKIRAPRGGSTWSTAQVSRLLTRLKALDTQGRVAAGARSVVAQIHATPNNLARMS
jgi:hypothetical protein